MTRAEIISFVLSLLVGFAIGWGLFSLHIARCVP